MKKADVKEGARALIPVQTWKEAEIYAQQEQAKRLQSTQNGGKTS